MISGHNLTLPRLPQNHTDSLRLGNGDIGVAVYAVQECLTLSVAKNDLLDYRMGEPSNPFFCVASQQTGRINPLSWFPARESGL